MSLVLDASATMGWLYVDERRSAIQALFDAVVARGAVVPPLWSLEVANSLQIGVRKGRITRSIRDRALTYLSDLAIEVDTDSIQHAWRETLALSDAHRLTAYDAAYLELAHRRRLPLATLDAGLAAAARAAGVALSL